GFFFTGGVVMFFDRAMYIPFPPLEPLRSVLTPARRLAMGNILFLLGLPLIIGPQKTVLFFARRNKLKGTAAFVAGILLILLRWPLVGFCIELYGIGVLFGDFLVTIGGYAGNVPVVGPWIRWGLERISGGRRNSELPV
ncbi:Golgi Transport, partial [Xylographa carneopallida]|nr:Golgi Transport [Xylographa carneopallida]